tara:strand:- start:482 stop:598 length:117 start_codon:yes stop_codon:yes gene_type:complete
MRRSGITSIGEVYKLRKLVEKIEKQLDKLLNIIDEKRK